MVEVLLRLDIKLPLRCFSRSQSYVGQTHTLLQLHNTCRTIYFPAGFGDNIHWRTLDDGKKEAEARWADAGKICTETMWDQHRGKKSTFYLQAVCFINLSVVWIFTVGCLSWSSSTKRGAEPVKVSYKINCKWIWLSYSRRLWSQSCWCWDDYEFSKWIISSFFHQHWSPNSLSPRTFPNLHITL